MRYRFVSITGLFLMAYLIACSSNKTITMLQGSGCPTSDTVMKSMASVLGQSQSWSVQFKVKVMCRSSVVKSAEIKIEYPWLPVFTITTNDQGIATAKHSVKVIQKPQGTIVMSIKTSNGVLNQAIAY